MASYLRRGKKVCPNCGRELRADVCEKCGCAVELRGKWSVRFRANENGARVNKRLSGFDTQQEAQHAYENYLKTHLLDNENFERLFKTYIKQAERTLKGSSIYNKIKIFELHILPYFGARSIFSITKRDLIDWRATLLEVKSAKSERKLSIKYVNNIRAELCAFYAYLSQNFDVPNIVATMKPLKGNWEQSGGMKFFDFAQFRRFITYMKRAKSEKIKTMWVTFFMMLYYTGARVGEVLALRDDDVDFSRGVLNITKSLTRKTLDGSLYKITTPKNKSSVRAVSLPNVLLGQLRQYLAWKRARGLSGTFLFGGNAPLCSFSYSRMLKNYSKIAGVPQIRIHDFRHSHTSLLINLGANVSLVARRLGHSNTQQTLNTYSHLFPNTDKEIMRILNRSTRF